MANPSDLRTWYLTALINSPLNPNVITIIIMFLIIFLATFRPLVFSLFLSPFYTIETMIFFANHWMSILPKRLFVCLVGWFLNVLINYLVRSRKSPKTELLTIFRAVTHETELGDHDFCLSRSLLKRVMVDRATCTVRLSAFSKRHLMPVFSISFVCIKVFSMKSHRDQ